LFAGRITGVHANVLKVSKMVTTETQKLLELDEIIVRIWGQWRMYASLLERMGRPGYWNVLGKAGRGIALIRRKA
jgi:hypothetical protein